MVFAPRMAKILIVGSGAREHALALALRGHDLVVAPGNAGTEAIARNADVPASDIPGLVELAVREAVELVVVGPEAPLTLGLVDALEARGVRAFGPTRAAARLEASKSFMKELCRERGIATADFRVFDDAELAKRYVQDLGGPVVVKADGLAAGKGVVVASTPEEALAAVERMMSAGELGEAGKRIVIEEVLSGEEASFHVVCDGTRAVALSPAQDHKRVFDGDRGPNTGGMGAYAPAPVVTSDVERRVMQSIVEPTLRAMSERGHPFRGVLFVGLMIDAGEPKVLEFNVRFGDPETAVLVPLLDGDWFALLDGAARGDLTGVSARCKGGAALAVVMAAHGYPSQPRVGDRIEGLERERAEGVFVLHAGTRRMAAEVVTTGGRVLTVGAYADTLREARDRAYAAVSALSFDGEQHRTDIGRRALG